KELDERSHNGTKYYRRVERKQVPYCYWLRGPVLAVSADEAVIQRVIDTDRQAPPADQAVPAPAQKFKEVTTDKALLGVWLNPRIIELELENKARDTQGTEAAFLKHFLVYWKAVDSLAFFVTPQKSLEMGVGVKARMDDLPKAARQYFATAAAPSELWNA